jgi:hypothetical protein
MEIFLSDFWEWGNLIFVQCKFLFQILKIKELEVVKKIGEFTHRDVTCSNLDLPSLSGKDKGQLTIKTIAFGFQWGGLLPCDRPSRPPEPPRGWNSMARLATPIYPITLAYPRFHPLGISLDQPDTPI